MVSQHSWPRLRHDCARVVTIVLAGVHGAPQRSASAATAASESSWSGREWSWASLDPFYFLLLPHQYPEEIHPSRAARWQPSSLCWDPGELHKQPQGDSEPAGVGVQVWEQGAPSDEAWVRSMFRLQWQRSQARRGDAHRWVTEGAAEISFTRVWL